MKRYGVKLSLTQHSTFRADHLLGNDFQSIRWFNSIQERDNFIGSYQKQHRYYRQGDLIQHKYEYIERDDL